MIPLIFPFLLLALIAADRLLKILSENFADKCYAFLCFKQSINYGAAFGILQHKTLLLIIIAFVLLIIMFFFFFKEKSKLFRAAIIFIVAGTIGNLIDRLFFGYVTDFLSIKFLSFHSSAFNLADLSNIVGAVLLLIFLFRKK